MSNFGDGRTDDPRNRIAIIGNLVANKTLQARYLMGRLSSEAERKLRHAARLNNKITRGDVFNPSDYYLYMWENISPDGKMELINKGSPLCERILDLSIMFEMETICTDSHNELSDQ